MSTCAALPQTIEGMTVDLPADMKTPRKPRNGDKLTKKQWEQTTEFRAAAAGYSKVVITGKTDAIVADLQQILATAEEEGHERPPKVVMFSTYTESFNRVRETLDRESIQFVYAAAQLAPVPGVTVPVQTCLLLSSVPDYHPCIICPKRRGKPSAKPSPLRHGLDIPRVRVQVADGRR